MAKQKRTEAQRMRDMAFVSKLLLEGRSSTEITLALNSRRAYNLSSSQVRYDVNKIRKAWVDEYIGNFDMYRAQEIVKINQLEREYWEAWSRSRRKKKKVSKTKSSLEGTGNYKGTQDTKTKNEKIELTPGDKKFLEGIQWCIEQRCRILGLESERTLNINWRKRAKEMGVDPDSFKQSLVDEFVSHAKRGDK